MFDTHHHISALIRTSTLALVTGTAALLSGCSHPAPESNTAASQRGTTAQGEQQIIDDSTAALREIGANPDFSNLATSLREASGVLIFPHVRKAAFIFGGEGGNGVLLARDAAGHWSPPAFYSIGAGSVGLQLGYENAAIVLLLMNQRAVESALSTGLKLGANVSLAGGTIGDSSETRAVATARDIRQFVDANGVFAGASLDGAVISSRRSLNQRYYGRPATARDIVMSRTVTGSGAVRLEQQLSALAASGQGPVAAR